MWNAASPWQSWGALAMNSRARPESPTLKSAHQLETRSLQSVKRSRVVGVALDKRGRVAPALEAWQRVAAQYMLEIGVAPASSR